MKTYVLLLLSICLCSGCKQRSKPQPAIAAVVNHTDSTSVKYDTATGPYDSILYSKIDTLPELKALKNKIDTAHVSLWITQRPDSSNKYYCLQAGVSDPSIFQVVYNFYIAEDLQTIRYLDTQNDSLITLKQWRNTRGW